MLWRDHFQHLQLVCVQRSPLSLLPGHKTRDNIVVRRICARHCCTFNAGDFAWKVKTHEYPKRIASDNTTSPSVWIWSGLDQTLVTFFGLAIYLVFFFLELFFYLAFRLVCGSTGPALVDHSTRDRGSHTCMGAWDYGHRCPVSRCWCPSKNSKVQATPELHGTPWNSWNLGNHKPMETHGNWKPQTTLKFGTDTLQYCNVVLQYLSIR